MTRKWIMRALCILCLAAMLTGCGREPEVTETTIEVKKNGQVVHTIIEDFSESYYNLDELESTIQQRADRQGRAPWNGRKAHCSCAGSG